MDLFNLESYTKDQQHYDPNSDSQVIFDETDENLQEMDSQDDIPMETSHTSSTENHPTAEEQNESHTGSESETEENGGDLQVDINEKLKELNSLFKPTKGRKKATKTSTPVTKGKKGQLTKQDSGSIKFTSTKKVAGKVVSVTSGSTASVRRTRSDETHTLQAPAPLGRRRSGRIAEKSRSPAKVQQNEPSPRKKNRNPRNQTEEGIEVIDLISAPPLVLPGVINLDSDDEDNQKHKARHAASHDASFEDNYEMSIKLRWNGSIQKYPLRKYQHFQDLIEKLAKSENVEPSQVILTLGDSKIIQPQDTPDSIKYNISMILSGRSISGELVPTQTLNKKPKRDKNMIKIRVQSVEMKRPLEMYIDKTRKFAATRHTIAEELKIDSEKLRLKFDGELIDLDEAPVDLDFDGGEMIDCEII
ncbi:DNA repair protein Rad60 [Culicoides brevitarsis]|uniref:DNA repair protein Rad60 n=1 Tax=Culicoides brevitarsis TaxID=469753 RepID=UPI00307C9EFB